MFEWQNIQLMNAFPTPEMPLFTQIYFASLQENYREINVLYISTYFLYYIKYLGYTRLIQIENLDAKRYEE
jgi:hypothetical protein